MPSSITHELIAKSAAALLSKEDGARALAAPDYFYLGAQGPDLYFFYKPQALKKNFGKILHRGKIYPYCRALLETLGGRTGTEREKCLSYALGFCTHLEADAAFHPFVYGYLREGGFKKKVHQRIENDWDVYYAATLEGRDVRGYGFPFDLKKIAREGVLASYVGEAAGAVGVKVKKGAFSRMLKFFGWYLKHFHRRHLRYLLPVAPQLYPRRVPDPAVLEGTQFERLTGERDADALYLSTVRRAAERMKEFLSRLDDGAPLSDAFSRHLLTGSALN